MDVGVGGLRECSAEFGGGVGVFWFCWVVAICVTWV